MNTALSHYQLAWLVESEPLHIPLGGYAEDVQRTDYPLPAELGVAWAEALPLAQGITLFRAVHALQGAPQGHLVPLLESNFKSDEPVFNAQIWTAGVGCHHEHWPDTDRPSVEILATLGQDTFRHHSAWSAKVFCQGGVTSEMFSIVIYDSALRLQLGADTAQRMLDDLGLGTEALTVVHAMPPHVGAPLREAMGGPYFGPVRKLYAQARALDYLAGLLLYLQNNRVQPKERRHRVRMRDVHTYLLQLEGALPTLNELAQQFGLSAQQLNKEFSTEYGKSIFSFITTHRLDQAHEALIHSAVPMKALSERLGYSHVNHFITAFKRQFGYPPGSLRRK